MSWIGQADASPTIGDGRPTILPAEKYGRTRNSENPELYVTYPYRLYGVGKPDLQLARDTFDARRFPMDRGWGRDGTQAAVLGLTNEARRVVVRDIGYSLGIGHCTLVISTRASRVSRVCHGSVHGLMIKKGRYLLICHGCHGSKQ
jgi:hypothetical protein